MDAQQSELYYFDEKAAQRPVNFIERYCRHLVGDLQGQLIKVMPYQKQIVRDVFGTKKKKDNYRRFRNVYMEVPKKNAKSILLSALGLYLTCADGEKGAEIFACAGDKDQARIIFDASREMVESDKRLKKIFRVYKNVIVHKKSKSRFRVISADAKTKHGPNVHALLFDELHVQPNGELWDTMTKGVANRKQPMVWAITTAGYKNTFAHKMHLMCKAIFDGRVKSRFWYVVMYGIEEKLALKDWDKEYIWKLANPGYGVTVDSEYYESQVEEIKMNPARLSGFLRLHLDVWTGTERAWEIVKDWAKGNRKVDPEKLKGRRCFMGVDLAPKNDTTSVVEIYEIEGKEEGKEEFEIYVHFFIPEATLDERKKLENDNWDHWVNMHLATVMPGNVTDDQIIFDYIKKRCETRQVVSIGCDSYNAYNLISKLQEEGLPADSYPQSIKGMSPPMKYVEKLVTAGRMHHGGNEVLAWQAGNVMVYEDTNQNRKPHKQKSKCRIDGIAALITAFGEYLADKHNQETKYKASDLIAFIDNVKPDDEKK